MFILAIPRRFSPHRNDLDAAELRRSRSLAVQLRIVYGDRMEELPETYADWCRRSGVEAPASHDLAARMKAQWPALRRTSLKGRKR